MVVEKNFEVTSRAAVLLSRQPICPCGKTPWVKAAIEAVKWVKCQGFGLLTSVGLQTWELLVFLAQKEKIRQTIVLPISSESRDKDFCDQLKNEFKLENHLTHFSFLPCRAGKISDKTLLHSRDIDLITRAEILIPISVRPGGFMEKFITQTTPLKTIQIVRRFEIPYKKRKHKLSYQINKDKLSSAMADIGKRYLIHWTRTSRGPWPTETKYNFYNAIINSDAYPRSAFETLKNILHTRLIKASPLHMPSNIPTVSFSALAPSEAVSLMRWRSRYIQMSFEPYGIGIEKEFARSYGIVPVQYYRKKKPPKCERWLTQSVGTSGNWSKEAEYRFKGDLDFSDIPGDKLIIFCYLPSESEYISSRFRLITVSIIS